MISSPIVSLTVVHRSPFSPSTLYRAWTAEWGTWFAEPESVRMQAVVGVPYHFEVAQRLEDGTVSRHPHYGRFLELMQDSMVALTWVTRGTAGAETTLTVQFTPDADGTNLILTHAGFTTEAARDHHAEAWRMVLAKQEEQLLARPVESGDAATPRSASAPGSNRSIPDATFIPVRSYPDLDAAVTWLHDVLGCRERLRLPGHRVQLTLGNGAVVAVAWDATASPATGGRPPATLMVRVSDIDATYARALAHGATGLSAPADQPYGERQAQVRDPAGHAWTLTQTIEDVDPATWGGVLVT